MQAGVWFYILSGVWAVIMLVIFIQAIRLSYRIEKRSPDLANRTGLPQRAQIFHTVTNWKVARDPDTQALRRRMMVLLLLCLAGMIAMGMAVNWVRSVG
jgi:hypothetical protein